MDWPVASTIRSGTLARRGREASQATGLWRARVRFRTSVRRRGASAGGCQVRPGRTFASRIWSRPGCVSVTRLRRQAPPGTVGTSSSVSQSPIASRRSSSRREVSVNRRTIAAEPPRGFHHRNPGIQQGGEHPALGHLSEYHAFKTLCCSDQVLSASPRHWRRRRQLGHGIPVIRFQSRTNSECDFSNVSQSSGYSSFMVLIGTPPSGG
jgi:hypothetical protein